MHSSSIGTFLGAIWTAKVDTEIFKAVTTLSVSLYVDRQLSLCHHLDTAGQLNLSDLSKTYKKSNHCRLSNYLGVTIKPDNLKGTVETQSEEQYFKTFLEGLKMGGAKLSQYSSSWALETVTT